MSHPMEGYYDAARAERERLWERRDAMEKRLADMPLSEFTVMQFMDLQLVSDRNAVSDRTSDLVKALDRFDAFLAFRESLLRPMREKPRKRRRK